LALGIPDAAYKPLAGDDKETAKHFEKRNKDERKGQGILDFAAGSGKLPAAAALRIPLWPFRTAIVEAMSLSTS
jgi:hypothetical protein